MTKTKTIMGLLTACGVLVLAEGCGRQAVAPPEAAQESSPSGKADTKAERAAQAAVPQQGDGVKAAEITKSEPAALQAVTDKPDAVTGIADAAATDRVAGGQAIVEELSAGEAARLEQSRISSLIESAGNLTRRNKYAEALTLLGRLSNAKLTPAQSALVDELRETAEKQGKKALIDKAASQAPSDNGNPLEGKN